MTPSAQRTSPAVTSAVTRACLLGASVLWATPIAFAQAAVLETVKSNESNQRQAAAQARANQEATGQRDAAKHFSVVALGVVKDSRTGLEWMRCSLGQDWIEKTNECKGGVNSYNWQGALDIAEKLNVVGGYAGRTNWRAPTVRELQSLRYCSNGYQSAKDLQGGRGIVPGFCAYDHNRPTIAQAVFPNMDGEYLWYSSSSLKAGDVSHA